MAELKDKVAGKTKQIVAEVLGDGQLREEGKRQEQKPDKPKPDRVTPDQEIPGELSPSENFQKLT